MKKQTLLQKAETIKPNNARLTYISEEHVELALAWIEGRINYKQISMAMSGGKDRGMNAYIFIARVVRYLVGQGRIIIKK